MLIRFRSAASATRRCRRGEVRTKIFPEYCASFLGRGIESPCSSATAIQPSMASRIMPSSSSQVSASVRHPGRSTTFANQPPPSALRTSTVQSWAASSRALRSMSRSLIAISVTLLVGSQNLDGLFDVDRRDVWTPVGKRDDRSRLRVPIEEVRSSLPGLFEPEGLDRCHQLFRRYGLRVLLQLGELPRPAGRYRMLAHTLARYVPA